MLQNVEAIIFDLDGTLIDSMWVWKEVDSTYLKDNQLELDEQMKAHIEGMSFTEVATFFKETFKLEHTVDEIKAEWIKITMHKYLHEVELKEGVMELLEYLRSTKIKMGIATSNSRELASAVLKRFGIDEYIDYFATGCEVKKGKPSPDVYLHVANKLGITPQRCLVFEDVPAGILAGKNAGMKVCAVDDRFSKHLEEKKKELADYFIFSFLDILEKN